MTHWCPKAHRDGRRPPHAAQRGVALAIAIFLIVALATLGAYMVSLTGTQQTTSSVATASAQTLLAARAGLDWSIQRARSDYVSMCAASPTTTSTSFSVDALGGINVTVTCSYLYNSSGATWVRTYYLTSTASYGTAGALDYVQRKLEASVCISSSAPNSVEC